MEEQAFGEKELSKLALTISLLNLFSDHMPYGEIFIQITSRSMLGPKGLKGSQ